jgi:hypothetical protein
LTFRAKTPIRLEEACLLLIEVNKLKVQTIRDIFVEGAKIHRRGRGLTRGQGHLINGNVINKSGLRAAAGGYTLIFFFSSFRPTTIQLFNLTFIQSGIRSDSLNVS